jgi:hypothetical protein
MRDFVARILDALTAGLLRQAERLVRLAATRHVVGAYQAAYDDVTALEAGGRERLARFLRRELDEELDGTAMADAAPLTLGGAGNRGPFALSGPAVAGSSEAAARASEPARRRGRPRSAAKGRKDRPEKRPEAAETIDESTTSSTLIGD